MWTGLGTSRISNNSKLHMKGCKSLMPLRKRPTIVTIVRIWTLHANVRNVQPIIRLCKTFQAQFQECTCTICKLCPRVSQPTSSCSARGTRFQSVNFVLAYLSTIKDWDQLHQRHFCVVFARLLCSAGITNENEFHTSSSPTLLPVLCGI